MNADERAATVARVRDELTTTNRRGNARARRGHPHLSLVDQSLLRYIDSIPGCRAVDIAAYFQLNKSTVSRQLKLLVEAGLVVESGSEGARGRSLTLSEAGTTVQLEAAQGLLETLTDRMSTWSDDEIEAFAAMLVRFNETAD